jgi:hypothetical protein
MTQIIKEGRMQKVEILTEDIRMYKEAIVIATQGIVTKEVLDKDEKESVYWLLELYKLLDVA